MSRARARSAARLAAVQALYQMEIGGADILQVVKEFETYRLGKEIRRWPSCFMNFTCTGLALRSRMRHMRMRKSISSMTW